MELQSGMKIVAHMQFKGKIHPPALKVLKVQLNNIIFQIFSQVLKISVPAPLQKKSKGHLIQLVVDSDVYLRLLYSLVFGLNGYMACKVGVVLQSQALEIWYHV